MELLEKGLPTAFTQPVSGKFCVGPPFAPVVLYSLLSNYLAQEHERFRLQSLNINAMFNTRRGNARNSIRKMMHRSVLKDKISALGSLCSQRMGGDWKEKRPPGVLGKYSTIRHIIKAEKTFQANWNFKSLETRSLA